MPKNRFADIRYQVLDRCLRDQIHYYTIYDLAEKCSSAIFEVDEKNRNPISIKQIRNDLKHLESEAGYKASILSRKIPGEKKHYFRYEDPDFSINQRPLSDQDADQLRAAISVLRRFKGLPFDNWIEEFPARIKALQGLDDPRKFNKHPIIRFDNEDYTEGSEWIMPIFRAIEEKRCLKINYKDFQKEEKEFLISPYLIKQYNRRWFVLCESEGIKNLTTLPFDRIQDINPTSRQYVPYPGDNPHEFFEDIVGVINDPTEKVLLIVLEVHKDLLPYLISKPIHETQNNKIIKSEHPDWYILSIKVKPNYELYSVLLSHGPRIRVKSPDKIIKKVSGLLSKMVDNYQEK